MTIGAHSFGIARKVLILGPWSLVFGLQPNGTLWAAQYLGSKKCFILDLDSWGTFFWFPCYERVRKWLVFGRWSLVFKDDPQLPVFVVFADSGAQWCVSGLPWGSLEVCWKHVEFFRSFRLLPRRFLESSLGIPWGPLRYRGDLSRKQ